MKDFRISFTLILLASLLAVLLSLLMPREVAQAGGVMWSLTGSMNVARAGHTATLLPNGQVLVTGGVDSRNFPTASAELYDPTTGNWMATGSMNVARTGHTATLLPNGQVLVAGGFRSSKGSFGSLSSAELYDPSRGSWTVTGSMNMARWLHTATLLPDGKVLVAGGFSNNALLSSAELYNPSSGRWTATGSMNMARWFHTATLLPDGKVLVAGGQGSDSSTASAELYDPSRGSWSLTGSLKAARWFHTATLLPNGQVLVAGGFGSSKGSFGSLSSAELYDPSRGSWTVTGSMNMARWLHTATLLPNGQVLVAGGVDSSNFPTASAELYNPGSGSWSLTGSLNVARWRYTATLLSDGKVLVALGDGSNDFPTASVELYSQVSTLNEELGGELLPGS